jgi:hypothetical protein
LDRDPRFNGPSDDSQGGSFFGATLPVAPESSEEQNLVKGGSFFGATATKTADKDATKTAATTTVATTTAAKKETKLSGVTEKKGENKVVIV